MELNIVSSSDEIKKFKVLWLEIETVIGGMVIQIGHAPTVLELRPNSVISFALSGSGKVEIIEISGGFAEVNRSGVKILLI